MYVSAFFISKVMYTTTEHTSEPVHRTGSGWLFRFFIWRRTAGNDKTIQK